ncbi:MAG: hypothetical protein AAF654_00830 [Myxococcota bacterium]
MLPQVIVLASMFTGAEVGGPAAGRDAFLRGMAALDEGKFQSAVNAFEECVELTGRASCGFNLAIARRGTGDYLGASEALTDVVSRKGAVLSGSKRTQIERLSAELKAATPVVTLYFAPEVEIYSVLLDGRLVRHGTSNAPVSIAVNPGRSLLQVTSPKMVGYEHQLDLQIGDRIDISPRLVLDLDASTGTLSVKSTDMTDRIDVQDVGTSYGAFERQLPSGSYRVVVQHGSTAREKQVEVRPGGVTNVAFEFDRGSWLSNPWLWAGAGAVVVGGIVAAIALRDGDGPELIVDSRTQVTEVLRTR